MNVSTSINYLWCAAAGALLHYFAVIVVGPRLGVRRTVVALTMCAYALLGIVVASGRDEDRYALIGIGFLGAVAPFTALASQALGQDTSRRSRRRTVSLAAGR
ncbi:hypothetical protein [Rhodococcus sp. IEGM 1351]|uniref:hypothetical protein n=1 Tax=Rhodococcus sp. IEGM 1351 TaxID=3047089 RepID=UPI0024B76186|nr:hypothetical protein [Rhodococcus sp. IEGM 1351]